MKKLTLVFLLIIHSALLAQDDAIVIWCSTESSITYPIVISTDSVSELFSKKQIKYRNRMSLKKERLQSVVLNDSLRENQLFTVFTLMKFSFNERYSNREENTYLSYPEIRYIKDGVISEKLVFENKENFIELMEIVKPYLKDELNEDNYIKLCDSLGIIYVDIQVRYFEVVDSLSIEEGK
jgi:hypothetical protein